MRRGVALATAAVALVALVPLSSPAPPPCFPDGSCPAGSHDIRTVAIALGAYRPDDIEDVHYGLDRISFVNLEETVHTVTDDRCLDGDGATPCGFDLVLDPVLFKPNQWQQGGTVVVVGAPNPFVIGETYTYRCTIHVGLEGRFTVVR